MIVKKEYKQEKFKETDKSIKNWMYKYKYGQTLLGKVEINEDKKKPKQSKNIWACWLNLMILLTLSLYLCYIFTGSTALLAKF